MGIERINNHLTSYNGYYVIRNVDEAVRIMVILNGEKTVYAKPMLLTGEAEEDTDTQRLGRLALLRQGSSVKAGCHRRRRAGNIQ